MSEQRNRSETSPGGEIPPVAGHGPSYWRNRWRCTLHPLMVAQRADTGSADAHYTYARRRQENGLPPTMGSTDATIDNIM